ncbi:MAG: peptidoglycan-binding protein, partial [Oscillospiraceae bacterium]|nr:peptidoglycan-binding protein [Oscillospiraceae bacterium]
PYEIITYYYGDDINILTAPIRPNIPTYPGTPLTIGSGGTDVNRIEIQLNRISSNYPAIPKIYPVDVTYDDKTADAVREFQRIFNLPQTGVVDKATWYKINYIYTSVKKLSQLNSEGLTLQELPEQFTVPVGIGATGFPTQYIQYYLEVIGAYYKNVLPVESTGVYDEQTADSVRSFQQVFGLPQTGTVDERTWDDLYRAYAGIVENVPINTEGENAVLFPGTVLTEGMTSPYVKVLQEYLSYIHKTYPNIPDVSATGYFGPITRNAVTEFQKQFGLQVTGSVGPGAWDAISDVYSDLRFGYVKQPGQYPGYIIE